jgi:hypothetical protein
MKKIIYILFVSFLFVGCSSEVEPAVVKNNSIENAVKKEPPSNYLLGEVTVKWNAFKHLSKAIVGGEFIDIQVTDFKDSSDLYSAIEGVSFELDVKSTKTGDTLRDYKIYNSFFGTMLNTQYISGKILSLNKNKTGMVLITMNNVSKEVSFDWDIDQTDEFFLKTSIDVLNWGASSALNALNEVCLEKHTGPDGVNKLWPNVDIVVIAKLISID